MLNTISLRLWIGVAALLMSSASSFASGSTVGVPTGPDLILSNPIKQYDSGSSDPQSATEAAAQVAAGITKYHNADYAGSEVNFRAAVKLQPDYYVNQLWLGASLFLQGKYKEAEMVRRKAARLQPDNGHLRADVGDAQFNQGKYGEAEDNYRLAIKLDATCAFAYANLAAALYMQGESSDLKALMNTAQSLGWKNDSYITFDFKKIGN